MYDFRYIWYRWWPALVATVFWVAALYVATSGQSVWPVRIAAAFLMIMFGSDFHAKHLRRWEQYQDWLDARAGIEQK